MIPAPRLPAFLAGLALLGLGTAALADDSISFKKRADREREFVGRVAAAIIKAARTKPQKIALSKFEYTNPKLNRTELVMKATYHGWVTKRQYIADMTVIIDSTDRNSWEVLNIKYADNNPSVTKPRYKKIQDLIPELNKR
jgi:hypothetical protein